jgi:cytidylate kinase
MSEWLMGAGSGNSTIAISICTFVSNQRECGFFGDGKLYRSLTTFVQYSVKPRPYGSLTNQNLPKLLENNALRFRKPVRSLR